MHAIKQPIKICLAIVLLILVSAAPPAYFAQAANEGVIIAPTRVVFSGRDRSQIVRLINKDSVARRFRISLIHISMDDKGTRVETTSPDRNQLLAQKMIRFAPRQITIPPEGWQTIRIMVRKPHDLADGEYRTHMKFAIIPDPEKKSRLNLNEPSNTPNTVGIKINIIMNVTIPLIVRQGQGGVKATPQSVILKKDEKSGRQIMEVELDRTGNQSLFADIAIFDDSAQDGSLKLGEIKGIAIYTPNTVQYVPIPVKLEDTTSLRGKNVRIEVYDREDKTMPLMVSKSLPML